METVEYKNISFTVWDVGGQDKVLTAINQSAMLSAIFDISCSTLSWLSLFCPCLKLQVKGRAFLVWNFIFFLILVFQIHQV